MHWSRYCQPVPIDKNVYMMAIRDPSDFTISPSYKGNVARVRAGRAEGAALVLNGNWLLLTRTIGTLSTHQPEWWDTYGTRNLLP